MALVMAMIVVVLITLLVAGAISFTGTERSASEVQSQQDVMSSCIQAARNLFLSKLRMSGHDINEGQQLDISFAQNLNGFSETLNGAPVNPSVRTGHLGDANPAVSSITAKKVTVMDDPMAQVTNISDQMKSLPPPSFYLVTTVCKTDTTDPSSAEREIEFMVRVGF